MTNEAKYYCMGILKGLYKVDKKSGSHYKNWALDIPGEYFEEVLNIWKNNCSIPEDIKKMKIILK